ncbi:MAG: helix-turn-helix transcriptional regulator [Thermoleophilia bacterium]
MARGADRVPSGEDDRQRPVYLISVAAELSGMHPQTLRLYERRGLVRPQRTAKNTRRYSGCDLERLQRIQELTELGLNLAGVERVLALEAEMATLLREVERLRADLDAAVAATQLEIERVEKQHRFELVPVAKAQLVPLGRRRRYR